MLNIHNNDLCITLHYMAKVCEHLTIKLKLLPQSVFVYCKVTNSFHCN